MKNTNNYLLINSIGCSITGNDVMSKKHKEGFIKAGWRFVWERDESGVIRFPKTDDEEIKKLQKEVFEEFAKEGEIGKVNEVMCLSDLLINAGW